jgi:hypothetical protein
MPLCKMNCDSHSTVRDTFLCDRSGAAASRRAGDPHFGYRMIGISVTESIGRLFFFAASRTAASLGPV